MRRYVDNVVKVRDHCHITGKYRGSVHRDCTIDLKLNHKNFCRISQPIKFDSHLIMGDSTFKLSKFHLKINVIPNGSEK